eukprot:CAMPEP_0173390018 /NCGR_PEP_ID=MMETSP1356-20130122/14248_1 /TAXON_ID=77927 ORGANISM="Hemiselmis virescens, Strain PCC157" /NCGR_SAMPLE_ID=MMETSP1356 /ASSEMBLY_ACC=CAM_ASM_000847 /LENGTH=223 /DNA_ID=CAMNT_0014347325 /DNA_START=22 /DNA_END=690 /DNA_ORIENTATION=+
MSSAEQSHDGDAVPLVGFAVDEDANSEHALPPFVYPAVLADEEEEEVVTGYPASLPGAEELRIIRETEKKMMEDGWHAPPPAPSAPGISREAMARLEASVEAAVLADEASAEDSVSSRCLHCCRWYPSVDPTQGGVGCAYHPGVYRNVGTTLSSGFFAGWSCCKELDERAGGCKKVAVHVEDVGVKSAMRAFGREADPTVTADMERRVREAEAAEREEQARAR